MRGCHDLAWGGCTVWLCIVSIVTLLVHDADAQSVDRVNFGVTF